jgi:spore germination protein YaaH
VDSLSLFIEHFIKRLLFFSLFIATIVVGIPALVVLSQPHHFKNSFDFSTQPVSSVKQINKTNSSDTPSNLISLGWLVGDNSQLTNYNDLKIVSPLFATIGATDQIQLNNSPSSISKLQAEGKKVWGRVTLDSQSDASTHHFFESPSGMNQVIQEITADAQQNHLDGLNLDIEQIPSTHQYAFSQFIKKLSKATQQEHLTLSIDLQPESNDNSASLSSFNQQLGKYSDYIIFMGYDEHWSTDSTPGPVTSLQWLEDNIKQFIQTGIPSQKLLLGLPSYSRIWQVNQNGKTISSRALSNEYVNTLMHENHFPETWEPKQADYYCTYYENGNSYKVWLTNNRSLEVYLNLAAKYHIGGIGFWNLNMMSSEDWNQLVTQFNTSHAPKL